MCQRRCAVQGGWELRHGLPEKVRLHRRGIPARGQRRAGDNWNGHPEVPGLCWDQRDRQVFFLSFTRCNELDGKLGFYWLNFEGNSDLNHIKPQLACQWKILIHGFSLMSRFYSRTSFTTGQGTKFRHGRGGGQGFNSKRAFFKCNFWAWSMRHVNAEGTVSATKRPISYSRFQRGKKEVSKLNHSDIKSKRNDIFDLKAFYEMWSFVQFWNGPRANFVIFEHVYANRVDLQVPVCNDSHMYMYRL